MKLKRFNENIENFDITSDIEEAFRIVSDEFIGLECEITKKSKYTYSVTISGNVKSKNTEFFADLSIIMKKVHLALLDLHNEIGQSNIVECILNQHENPNIQIEIDVTQKIENKIEKPELKKVLNNIKVGSKEWIKLIEEYSESIEARVREIYIADYNKGELPILFLNFSFKHKTQ